MATLIKLFNCIFLIAGYYCENGTSVPARCEYPYYCPQGSSYPRICPLGYKATTINGNRTSADEACLICAAGYYGNDRLRLNCTKCPAGYFCPQGTKDPHENECPVGHYCPEGVEKPVSYVMNCFFIFFMYHQNFVFQIRFLCYFQFTDLHPYNLKLIGNEYFKSEFEEVKYKGFTV